MILLGVLALSSRVATSFVTPFGHSTRSSPRAMPTWNKKWRSASQAMLPEAEVETCTWSPQDLTINNPGFPPIPDDDYIKEYQRKPELWPVEFFVIAYRRMKNEKKRNRTETQILVRRSANGTSKYGVGTGVPATRWVLSSQTNSPAGYDFSQPTITYDARNFPEFPNRKEESWTYTKIDIKEDAFQGSDELKDPELEEYASKIRDELRAVLSKKMQAGDLSPWQRSTSAVVKQIVDHPNSVAAIQGSLRMSGLFEKKEEGEEDDGMTTTHHPRRFVSFEDAPDPARLVESSRVYTMFPQMPCPMLPPSASTEELRHEISSREARMAESGRDPHKDKYGRIFTHKSTSNVSNTIHGIYLTFDATGLPGLDNVPALDLFGTKKVDREWVPLSDLKVTGADGETIGTADTKPTFISGFIVRQLVEEGAIQI